jgi:hypothetical protein
MRWPLWKRFAFPKEEVFFSNPAEALELILCPREGLG